MYTKLRSIYDFMTAAINALIAPTAGTMRQVLLRMLGHLTANLTLVVGFIVIEFDADNKRGYH